MFTLTGQPRIIEIKYIRNKYCKKFIVSCFLKILLDRFNAYTKNIIPIYCEFVVLLLPELWKLRRIPVKKNQSFSE